MVEDFLTNQLTFPIAIGRQDDVVAGPERRGDGLEFRRLIAVGGRAGRINLKTAVGVGWSADCLAFSTSGCGSAGREAWGRTQLTALKENLEGSR
jgi:hypothetical protein